MQTRILLLNYEYPPLGGGAANALYYLLQEFSAFPDSLRVDLVTSSALGRFERVEMSENITLHKLAVKKKNPHYWTERELISYSAAALKYAGGLAAVEDYDLCHAFFAVPCGYLAYRLSGSFPYIVSLRGSDVPGFNARFNWMNPVLRPIFRLVLGRAAAVQANSRGLRELAAKTAPGVPVEIIFNGVDCRAFAPGDNPRGGGGGKKRIITVSRLIGRKGIGDLIAALPDVVARVGEVELTIVGEGKLMAQLKAQAAALGIGERVVWLGFQAHDDLPNLYRRADLFVLPSWYEGMSNALLEAMACGLPVVTTNTGGTAELVDGNGLVVEAGNPVSLAGAIGDILGNEPERRRMAVAGRAVAERFSWENVAKQYLAVYKGVCGGKRARQAG